MMMKSGLKVILMKRFLVDGQPDLMGYNLTLNKYRHPERSWKYLHIKISLILELSSAAPKVIIFFPSIFPPTEFQLAQEMRNRKKHEQKLTINSRLSRIFILFFVKFFHSMENIEVFKVFPLCHVLLRVHFYLLIFWDENFT